MSNITPLTIETAPEASQPLLTAVQAKMGMVPNLLGVLAQSPSTLQSYLSLSEALGGGAFSAGERELIALAIGEANSCDYCLAAHTMIGGMQGLEPEAMNAARSGGAADAKSAALTALAREIVVTRGRPEASIVETFRSVGYTDEHLVQLIAEVTLNTLTNYTNHIADTEIDFPAAPELQSA